MSFTSLPSWAWCQPRPPKKKEYKELQQEEMEALLEKDITEAIPQKPAGKKLRK